MLTGMAVTLLLTLHFTLPSANAGPGECEPGIVPLTDLATVEVWRDGIMIRQENVESMEGQPYTIDLPLDRGITVEVTTTDLSGNRSCPATLTIAGVGPNIQPETKPVPYWVDVTGRRYDHRPTAPGVYWRRDGRALHRIIIVR